MYPFGYGLSYTTFKYSNLKLSSNKFTAKLIVTIDVTNPEKWREKKWRNCILAFLVKSWTNRRGIQGYQNNCFLYVGSRFTHEVK